uniref:Uncharacterized protein n=1 Tax=Anolis carolinensis TaxID=28377 RepID=A0A803T6V5_ANOCA
YMRHLQCFWSPVQRGRYMRVRCRPNARFANCIEEQGPVFDISDGSANMILPPKADPELYSRGKGFPLTLSLDLSDSEGWCSFPFLSRRVAVVRRHLQGHVAGMTAWSAVTFPSERHLSTYSHLHVFELLGWQKLELTAATPAAPGV